MAIFKIDTTDLYGAILRAVAYEDIFDYPLSAYEIFRLLPGIHTEFEAVESILKSHPLLSFSSGYYTLPGRERLVSIRSRRNQAAERLWPQAVRYGKMITSLPFVRMLAVTGSLAMNNIDEGADIDFLLVTAAGHLWTCRALVLAVARLAALHGVHLCPNYLITERALVFTDRSLYTAHELVQMAPLFGLNTYHQIRHLNRWTEQFLPNAGEVPPISPASMAKHTANKLQSALESGLHLPPGLWLEQWEMRRKIRKLTYDQDENPEASFSKDVCKGHLHRHGLNTELSFNQRLKDLPMDISL